MRGPRIKGRVILESMQLTREKLGDAFYAKVVAKLDEPLRALVEQGLIQSSWYPVDLLTQYMEIQVEMLGLEVNLFRKLAEEATSRQLSGVYRALLEVDPGARIRKFRASHLTYLQGVTATAVSIESASAVLRFEGLEKQHRLMEPLMAGFARKYMSMTGLKNPKAEFIVPIGDLSGHADMKITWE